MQLIRDTKEKEVRRYLVRSFQAFKDGHLEAAVILAWAGVERYYGLVRDDIGVWYFEEQYQKEYPNRKPHEWSVAVLDSISFRTQIFANFKINPEDKHSITYHESLKELRHQVAHGRGTFCSKTDDVLEAIMTSRFIAVRDPSNEKFSNTDKVVDFLMNAQLPQRINGLLARFPTEMDWIPVSIRLNTAFLKSKDSHPDSVRVLATSIYRNVTDDKRLLVWENYAHQALKCLVDQEYQKRTPVEIYSFLPRPSSLQILAIRDQFLEHYFTWLEKQIEIAIQEFALLEDDPNRTPDEFDRLSGIIDEMMRKIGRDVPDHLKDKWTYVQSKWGAT